MSGRRRLGVALALAGIAGVTIAAPSPAQAWDPVEQGPATASLEGRRVVEARGVRLYLPLGSVGDEALSPEHRILLADLERAVAEIAPRVPVVVDPPLTVAVERDYTALAEAVGQVAPAVVAGAAESSAAAEVHLVWHPLDGYAYRRAVAGALLRRAGLTDAKPWWVRGAELWLAGEWFGRRYEEWLPRLAEADVMPQAADLLAEEIARDASEPLWTPVAAAVVGALGGDTAAEKLARIPSGGFPGSAGMSVLLAQIEAAAAAGPAGRTERVPSVPPFLAGVSLAMLNRVDGGYHAPSLDDALERLADLGADSVALMPFAYQPQPNRPGLSFMNRHPGSETDAGVVHAARRAHERGFTVLWKPHLWISWESWPGEVAMESEADWALWWRGYRRYVLHHAFLAAWTGSEVLSVGVELERTVHREREWRELAAAARVLFPGALTYSANWYEGAQTLEFWDALDLVGVDAYYPLTEDAAASDEALRQGAQRVVARLAALAEKTGKPVVLTEIGFAARRAPWREPHGEGGELSVADQARAYEALLGALGRPSWLGGAFFWKAFSGPRRRGERADFGFLGRPAERAIGRWLRATPAAEGGIPAAAGAFPQELPLPVPPPQPAGAGG